MQERLLQKEFNSFSTVYAPCLRATYMQFPQMHPVHFQKHFHFVSLHCDVIRIKFLLGFIFQSTGLTVFE